MNKQFPVEITGTIMQSFNRDGKLRMRWELALTQSTRVTPTNRNASPQDSLSTRSVQRFIMNKTENFRFQSLLCMYLRVILRLGLAFLALGFLPFLWRVFPLPNCRCVDGLTAATNLTTVTKAW